MTDITLLLIIIFLAGLTQGLTGFGSVILSLPLLALFMDIKTIIPLVTLYALVINAILLVSLHKKIKVERISILLLGTIPGIPTGVYLLKTVPAEILQAGLGAVLILFSVYALFLRLPRLKTGLKSELLAGFLAGGLGGSIGANGPPVIIYTAVQPWEKDDIKACLVAYFSVAGLGISSTHAATGLITAQVVTCFLTGLPALIGGVLLGSKLYGKLRELTYKKFIYLLLLALGTIIIVKTVV